VAARHGVSRPQRGDAAEARKTDALGRSPSSLADKNPARKNVRSLAAIADEIHEYRRIDIFAVGGLLLEANAQCEYGGWLDWLNNNFGWSQDTAERYMSVARLAAQFPQLRKLKLASTTLYAFAREDESSLPAMFDALAKAGAAKVQIKPHDANRVIHLVRLRREWGDYPDATLCAFDLWCQPGAEAREEIIAALKKHKPEKQEAAEKIVAPILDKVRARFDVRLADAKPQPQIPTPQTPTPEIERPIDANDASKGLGSETAATPEAELLDALKTLLQHAQRRPLPKIAGGDVSSVDVSEIIDFLGALHRSMLNDSKAKMIADRAEARSRKSGGAA
jgi:Protein of unknown function (DUF3102)